MKRLEKLKIGNWDNIDLKTFANFLFGYNEFRDAITLLRTNRYWRSRIVPETPEKLYELGFCFQAIIHKDQFYEFIVEIFIFSLRESRSKYSKFSIKSKDKNSFYFWIDKVIVPLKEDGGQR